MEGLIGNYLLLLFADDSTTMIVRHGPIIEFPIANQNVKDLHQIEQVKSKLVGIGSNAASCSDFSFLHCVYFYYASTGKMYAEKFADKTQSIRLLV